MADYFYGGKSPKLEWRVTFTTVKVPKRNGFALCRPDKVLRRNGDVLLPR